MVRPVVEGSADYITQEMMQAEYGEHNPVRTQSGYLS